MAIADAYRLGQTAIQLSAMFIAGSEIAAASEAFAVKFADIAARHVDYFTAAMSLPGSRHRGPRP